MGMFFQTYKRFPERVVPQYADNIYNNKHKEFYDKILTRQFGKNNNRKPAIKSDIDINGSVVIL